jgi:pimeloyl-ACP methyl ester carboxylesterase
MRMSGAMWGPVADRLRPRHPVVTPDLPGHGSWRDDEFTLDGAVALVRAAIDEVGGRALVVGHSLGGGVATATAARCPAAVAGLVGIGCTFPGGRLGNWGAPFYRALGAVLNQPRVPADRLTEWLLRRLLPTEVAEAAIAGGFSEEAVAAVTEAVMGVDWPAEVARYRGPVWLVNGGFDQFRGGEKQWLTACAHGRLAVWPRLNHISIMGEVERIATLVDDACAVAAHRAAP